MAKKTLEFGRKPPRKAKVAWGARAIFKPSTRNPMVDILWDRQSAFGDKEDREALVAWVRDVGLPNLEEKIEGDAGYGSTLSTDVWTYKSGGYHIEASPQRSGGYLYIGAWPT